MIRAVCVYSFLGLQLFVIRTSRDRVFLRSERHVLLLCRFSGAA